MNLRFSLKHCKMMYKIGTPSPLICKHYRDILSEKYLVTIMVNSQT